MAETAANSLQLLEIAEGDLEDAARFIQRWSDVPLRAIVDRLSWLLLENPARLSSEPLGWFLRGRSGEIIGCMFCAPQRFCLDKQVVTLMTASTFYVDGDYRGAGASILLKFMALGRKRALFTTSANPTVARMWETLGADPIGYSDHEMLGIVRWQPAIAEAIHRTIRNDALANGVGWLASPFAGALRRMRVKTNGCRLVLLKTPEEAAGQGDLPRGVLTSVRDEAYLRWRYFSPADPTTRLFAFVHQNGGVRGVVGVNMRRRGHAQQIRTLYVLDMWGNLAPEAYPEIAACLASEYEGQIDMLVFRCLSPAQRNILRAKGLILRRFEAPIAWCLDKFSLLPSKNWYFVPADGDMVF